MRLISILATIVISIGWFRDGFYSYRNPPGEPEPKKGKKR